MKSIIVFFVAVHLSVTSALSFAFGSGDEEMTVAQDSSMPLILADRQGGFDDSDMNPSSEDYGIDGVDNSSETGGSSSETGGSSSETGGSDSETGGSDSETGGSGSETGGRSIEEGDDFGNNSNDGSY
ncbi:MAG: hypothetical protein ACU837_11770 [Gammaproteobacteria bacterium]